MQMGRTHFQVSGLSRREPGSGVQVRVQVRALTLSRGRADHPWSAAVEQGCSTLPMSGGGGKRLAVGNSSRPLAAGTRSRLPKAERPTPERLMP